MRAFCYEKEIVVFWHPIKLDGDYSIFLNGKQILKTEKTFCRIQGLEPNTEYKASVSLLHGNKSILVGEIRVKTENEKQIIDVTKPPYNAVGDGKTLNTVAIQRALDDCKANCKVVIPKGVYLSGGLKLKSDCELYLEEGATLQGSENPKDYLPMIWSRFEGIERYAYQSLINVF